MAGIVRGDKWCEWMVHCFDEEGFWGINGVHFLGLVVMRKAEAYGEVTLPLADSTSTGAGAGQ